MHEKLILTSSSGSLSVYSCFLTVFNWFRNWYLAAWDCSFANLFSCLATFFNVGLTLVNRKNTVSIYYKRIVLLISEFRWILITLIAITSNINLQFSFTVVHLKIQVSDLKWKKMIWIKEFLQNWNIWFNHIKSFRKNCFYRVVLLLHFLFKIPLFVFYHTNPFVIFFAKCSKLAWNRKQNEFQKLSSIDYFNHYKS